MQCTLLAPVEPSIVNSPHNSSATQIPDPPLLDIATGRDERPAIKDVEQAFNICRSIEWGCRSQIRKAAAVQRLIDGRPPFSPNSLRESGNAWQSNVNTGFLASIIETVYPRLYLRLKNVRTLTAAKLPDTVDAAQQKTENFQTIFTDTVRSWKGWNVFLQYFAKEICTYGFGFPTFCDPFSWRPTMFRVDEAFVPQGTPILYQDMQYYILRQDWDVYDLYDKIRDLDPEENDAGWNVLGCYESINAAHPKDRAITGTEVDIRRYQDLVRELIPASSYQKGWNLVETYRIWCKEANGNVSERIIDLKAAQGRELYFNEDTGLEMKDIALPCVFEFGNGTVYGSKGVGVMLYEQASMIERSRNRATDNLANLNRYTITVPNESDEQKVKLSVFPLYNIIKGGTITSTVNNLPNVAQASIELDKYWTQIAQQRAGAYMPLGALDAAEKTATQAKIDALQSGEKDNVNADNMLTQYQMLTCMMMRRMFDPDSTDAEGRAAYAKCLQAGLSPDEIRYLANCPPYENVVDLDDAEGIKQAAYLGTLRGNPNYNQHTIEEIITTTATNPDIAKRVLLPVNDTSELTENVSQQNLENLPLSQGTPMPVRPRDNDAIHMSVIQGQQDPQTGHWNNPITQSLGRGNFNGASMLLGHYAAHLQAGQQKKKLGEAENGYKNFLGEMQKLIQDTQKAILQQQQAGITGAPMPGLPTSVPPQASRAQPAAG